jgi:uncharacterized protein
MSLKFNIRHLEERNLSLKGDLAVSTLDLESLDELIHVEKPLAYDLELQELEHAVLVHGTLRLELGCECARCLKQFKYELLLENWACHLPLKGEDQVEVVNDSIDLTPYIREDIVLSFPQQPLCEPECKGLQSPFKDLALGGLEKKESPSSAWAELNKLKL